MKFYVIRLVVIACVVFANAASAVANSVRGWAVHDRDFVVRGDAATIDAIELKTGRVVFSADAFASAEFRLLRTQSGLDASDHATPFYVRQAFKIVSLFGPYLALRDRTVIEQGSVALPGGGVRFWTFDLRNGQSYNLDPSRPLSAIVKPGGAIIGLQAFYPPSQIAFALARDPFVREYRHGGSADSAKAILDQVAQNIIGTEAGCFDVPHDVFTRFAIVSAAGDHLGIRLGLPGLSACRDRLTVLGLELPVSVAIKSAVGAGARVMQPPPTAQSTVITHGHALSDFDGGPFFPPQ